MNSNLSMENNAHIKVSTYCCFLPDLTRFTASHCAGPKPYQAKLSKGNFVFRLKAV